MRRKRRNPNGSPVWQYRGYVCKLTGGVSYSCPQLKLFGYATPTQLERAIDRMPKKRVMVSNPAIKVGDRVAYSASWLRSTGQVASAGDIGHARGTVTAIKAYGSMKVATVKWDTGHDAPPKVAVANLARVGGAGFSAMNPGSVIGGPGKRLPPGVDGTTKLKSRGHIKFAGPHEYFRASNGDVYRASISDVMDMDTGQRAGRFEATATTWKRLGSNPRTRTALRKLQDEVIRRAISRGASEDDRLSSAYAGSPTIRELRQYIHPKWEEVMEQILNDLKREGSNPRTRWGQTIRKGAHVSVARANGPHWHGTYVKLDKPSDLSRAYGKQAIVKLDSGGTITTSIDDLTLAAGSNPRYAGKLLGTISARMGSRLRGQAQRAIGRILPQDVGKQVFDVGGVIQVENNEQRDRRMGRNPRHRKAKRRASYQRNRRKVRRSR